MLGRVNSVNVSMKYILSIKNKTKMLTITVYNKSGVSFKYIHKQ